MANYRSDFFSAVKHLHHSYVLEAAKSFWSTASFNIPAVIHGIKTNR